MGRDFLIKGFAVVLLLAGLLLLAKAGRAQGDTSMPVEATDATFDQEVSKSDLPVILEFYSPRCGHCMKMESVVNSLAGEFAGQAKVVKVNVLSNAVSPSRFGVHGVPAFYIVKNGEVVTSAVGSMSEDELRRRLGLEVSAAP